jgi:putative membrane-bound dehydrogenase-like protein
MLSRLPHSALLRLLGLLALFAPLGAAQSAPGIPTTPAVSPTPPTPSDPSSAPTATAAALIKPTPLPVLLTPLPTPAPDWKVESLAQPPQLIHPSVVCAAPDGRIFVAQDPIDMGQPSDATADSILVIHLDGKITKFAEGLHAVFGLYYLDGKLYVHHTPNFTVFTDRDSVGTERTELFTTNPNPNLAGKGFNDHIPSNLRLGMDGWFYMSTGDKGIFGATGADGSHAEIQGGGLIRFRPDGTHLEVYATGTRNHLDFAINSEDEIFTYDNTDDGNGWWTRVTHMVDGGFYGYPFDYKPQRPYTLWMMADYGGGSPTGAIAYNEDALPAEYRGNLFLCEWGRKQLLRLRVSRDGATYKIDERVQTDGRDFLTEGTKPFRPVGIALAPDGLSFYIADWNYGGWKSKTIAGRLLKVTYTGPSLAAPKPAWWVPAASGRPFTATTAELVAALGHPAQNVRLVAQRRLAERGAAVVPALKTLLADTTAPAHARWHAIWTLDAIDAGASARTEILQLAAEEPDVTVRAQAIRQLGTRRVATAVPALIAALTAPEALIRFRAATALGRIGQPAAVAALSSALGEKDLFARYAAFTALRKIGTAVPAAWSAIAAGLGSGNPAIREGTRFALREIYAEQNVNALADFVATPTADPEARAAALTFLADLHRKPLPWDGKWWGTQPVLREAPAPHTQNWAGTPRVLAAITAGLGDAPLPVRRAAVASVAIAGLADVAPQLRAMLATETDLELRRSLIRTLGNLHDSASGPLLAALLAAPGADAALVPEALAAAGQINDPASLAALIAFVQTRATAENLVLAAKALGATKAATAVPAAALLLRHPDAAVRTAASEALAAINGPSAIAVVVPLIHDPTTAVRLSAITTLGLLKARTLIPNLIALYAEPDLRPSIASALARMPDIRALDIYLETIASRDNALREQGRRAINSIRDSALPIIEQRHRETPFTGGALATLQRVYQTHEKALTGPLFEGNSKPVAPDDYARFALRQPGNAKNGRKLFVGEAGCIACHHADGLGANIGPALDSVGSLYGRAALIESVIYPSKQIFDGYHTVNVSMKNGDTFAGFLRYETAEEVLIVDVAGTQNHLPKPQIATRVESNISLMPEGLQSALSLAEFSDLISYLESLRGKADVK